MSCIPVIDITPLVQLDLQTSNENSGSAGSDVEHDAALQKVVGEIAKACKTYGFFAITNHGVHPTIINRTWNASREFFDMDLSIKSSVSMSSDYPYGYEHHEMLGMERKVKENEENTAKLMKQASALPPDSKETFSIGPVDPEKSRMPGRRFPCIPTGVEGAPSEFESALTEYFTIMEKLARILFRGFALALELGNANWFLSEGLFDDGHQCALRILNYPELDYEINGDSSASNDVRIRAGAHTDYGAMTILKSGGPGLQLQLQNETGGDSSWIDVPHLSDALIINLGDLMQRWTNNRWRSTLHRVVAVADCTGGINSQAQNIAHSARRQSIAFFVNMNGNATIVPFDSCVDDEHPVRYDAINASEYLIQRHAQSMGESSK